MDINIQALCYAQDGSFFVIPAPGSTAILRITALLPHGLPRSVTRVPFLR